MKMFSGEFNDVFKHPSFDLTNDYCQLIDID